MLTRLLTVLTLLSPAAFAQGDAIAEIQRLNRQILIRPVPVVIGVKTPNGTDMLSGVRVLIASSTSPANACFIQFDVVNRRLALYNDAGMAVAGTLNAGAAGSVRNTQCTISGASLSLL